ncbi:acyl carrier protein [Amycolatopsis sp. NPDC004079]|uniref:acyl carrier protein n=1 Tax=Amycolatopsis sp. NPDC004079 TaxID=3154549 RepID=UPI0033B11ED9
MSLDDLVGVMRDELGLPVTAADVEVPFDELAGWDSAHLLWLLSVLERRAGAAVSLPDLLEAATLRDVHALLPGS